MTFPQDVVDHSKENLTQKCFYLVSLIKAKDLALWNQYSERLKSLKPEESWAFYHELVAVYQKLLDKPDLSKPVPAKAVKPTVQNKPEAKKAPVKKVAKKVAKKAPVKKVAKKVAKKAPVKKVAKKVAKKAPVKKVAKKVAKKAPAKKTVKKKSK